MLLNLNITFVDINSEQRHNAVTSHSSNIEQERVKISRWFIRHSVDQEASKLISSNENIFAFSCIYVKISYLFCGVFFAVSSPNTDTVSEFPKKSGSKARQVFSSNTTQF